MMKLRSEVVWDAWGFVLKGPLESNEGVNPRPYTVKRVKLATSYWWSATSEVEEDGKCDVDSPCNAGCICQTGWDILCTCSHLTDVAHRSTSFGNWTRTVAATHGP